MTDSPIKSWAERVGLLARSQDMDATVPEPLPEPVDPEPVDPEPVAPEPVAPAEPERGIGDNSRQAEATDKRLKLLFERIERLEEEKAELAKDVREVFKEAKNLGYDAKIMRQLIRLRKMDTAARHEMEALLDTYKSAVGMD